MKFLICPASQDLLDFCDTDDFFYSPGGTAFNYTVEFVEDEYIRITDTVGRVMPIDINELQNFIEVLNRINNYTQDKAAMDAILISNLTYGASQ